MPRVMNGGSTRSSTRSTRAALPTAITMASATSTASSRRWAICTSSASTRSGSRPVSLRRKLISATTFPTTRTSIPCTARSRILINWWRKARSRKSESSSTYVINHTSDQHKWFLASKSSKTSSHRNWYVWRDAKPGTSRPTIGPRTSADRPGSSIPQPTSSTTTTSMRSNRT